jgi:hypothetical protein
MSNILCIGASGFAGTRFMATANDSFVISNPDKQQSPFFSGNHRKPTEWIYDLHKFRNSKNMCNLALQCVIARVYT